MKVPDSRYYIMANGKSVELIKNGNARYPEGHPLLRECIGQLALEGMEYELDYPVPDWVTSKW